MSGTPGTRTRRLAARILALRLSGLERGEVLDDLEELARLREQRSGRLTGRAYFWWQVLAYAFVRGGPFSGGGGGWMSTWGQELRIAVRRLVRAPLFTLVSVLTIGVGIGAFSSVFSVVDAVLLEKPGYEEPDDLVWVWRRYWYGLERGWLAGPDITGLRQHDGVFSGVVGLRSGGANLTDMDGEAPRRVTTMLASAELFDVLGVQPRLGRGFAPEDDLPDAAGVTVLGHDLWASQFASDPDIVGREILLNSRPVQVVGVMPADFRFVKHASLGDPVPADLYLPLRTDLAAQSPGTGAYAGLARVRPEATPGQVEAAVSAVAAVTDELWGNPGLEMWSVPLREDLVAGVRPALLALLGAAGFLLLVLGANLATLFLSRANARDRELAVRAAVGAGRSRLFQTVASEGAILAGAGVLVGLVLGAFGVDLLRQAAPENLPRLWALEMDATVALAALAATLLMALAAGAAPALYGATATVADRLRDGGARASGGRRSARTRSTLVVVQVALSLMLLVGAGLTTRAFASLLATDAGFDVTDALTFTVPLDGTRYPDTLSIVEFDAEFRRRVTVLPRVVAAGAADALPLSARTNQMDVAFPGAPGNTGDEDEDTPLIDEFRIGPGYAEAAGLRVLAGRSFADGDATDAADVALIDEILARRFFPGADPLGASLVLGADTAVVVGVVDHARQYQVYADDRPQVYRPLSQRPTRALSYAVRVSGDPALMVEAVRRTLAELDPGLPMSDPRTLDDIVAASLGRERLSLSLLLAFAAGALVLASMGIYGVVSHGVMRRTQEIGVRIALGADRGRVAAMVFVQGVRLAAVGVLFGLVGALATSRVLGSLVIGADQGPSLIHAAVVAGLLGLAGLASYVPARRATRIDPIEALRPD